MYSISVNGNPVDTGYTYSGSTNGSPEYPDISYNSYLKNASGSWFGNLVGSIFGGYKNWANSQITQYQNAYNQWQQNLTNAYNSPANQADLYEQAGFNRNLLASQATGSSSQSPLTSQVPSVSDVGQGAFSSLGTLIQLASGIIGLKSQSAQAAKASAEADILRSSADSEIFLRQMNANNAHLKYQLGSQEGYFKDWLYGTGVFPSSGMDNVSNSPYSLRYSRESQGIAIVNLLRQLQSEEQSLSNTKLKHYNEVLQPIYDDILTGKKTIQEGEAELYKVSKYTGIGSQILTPLISILRLVLGGNKSGGININNIL